MNYLMRSISIICTRSDMNSIRLYLIVIILILTTPYTAPCNNADLIEQMPVNIKLSYNSTLLYPGLRIGTELPFFIKHITGSNKKNEPTVSSKVRLASVNLSWYHHPGFHENFYLTAGWIMRRIGARGFVMEFDPEIGISRTFPGGLTYSVNEDDQVSIERFPGYWYALISAGFALGYDMSKVNMKPFVPFFKFNVISMFPYNSTIYLRPAAEIGLIYKSGRFFRNVRSKRVVK